jgi:hypothetical protein
MDRLPDHGFKPVVDVMLVKELRALTFPNGELPVAVTHTIGGPMIRQTLNG